MHQISNIFSEKFSIFIIFYIQFHKNSTIVRHRRFPSRKPALFSDRKSPCETRLSCSPTPGRLTSQPLDSAPFKPKVLF